VRARPRWSVGGDFPWAGAFPQPAVPWPRGPLVWMSAGRHAIPLLQRVASKNARLWLPLYFCGEVAKYWKRWIEVCFYEDDPRWSEPDWKTLKPDPGDLVVAVNYFGGRTGSSWNTWRKANRCLLVEDHTHDPCSPWARNSGADYAFCSLRKTLPLPEGGLLWSPLGLSLPDEPRQPGAGVAEKLAGMLLRAEFIKGAPVSKDWNPIYRALFREGEIKLAASAPAAMSTLVRTVVAGGVPVSWLKQRRRNTGHLLRALRKSTPEPLFRRWPRGATPLAVVLVLDNQRQRDRARAHLERKNIYCPILWPDCNSPASPGAPLAERILCIPTDQRYGKKDMEIVAREIRSVLKEQS